MIAAGVKICSVSKATWMTDLSMESLFVMGNGSAVNEHIRKEQQLSKPNLTSI